MVIIEDDRKIGGITEEDMLQVLRNLEDSVYTQLDGWYRYRVPVTSPVIRDRDKKQFDYEASYEYGLDVARDPMRGNKIDQQKKKEQKEREKRRAKDNSFLEMIK